MPAPPAPATLSEADLLSHVIAAAFAQAGGTGNIRLMELRETTPAMRVWRVNLSVDGTPCTYRVFSDGQSVSTKAPVE